MRLELKSRSISASLILSVVYVGAAKLGLMLAIEHPSATAVWPPTGIGLAALLIFGYRLWPGIFAGAFVANITTAGSIATALGIATGNTLESVVGCYLVTRFANGRAPFSRPQDVFKFTGLAGLLATAISASGGVASLTLTGYARWADFGPIWLTWWLGDASGALIVAPALLLWSEERGLRLRGRRGVETLAALSAVVISTGAVFGNWFPSPVQRLQSLTLPALIWVAFRLGPREAATALLMMSAIALVGTVRGLGPFAGWPSPGALRSLQVYLSIRAVTALVIAAAVNERRRLEAERRHLAAETEHAAEVKRSEARLRALLEAAPDPTVVVDQDSRIVFVNSRMQVVFGYASVELVGQPIEMLVPEGLASRHADHDEACAAGAPARPMGEGLELHGQRRDGTQFPVEISLGPIQTDEGVLICAAVRDTSERRRVEEELREANQALEAFAYSVSHDLRAPLRGIRGLAQALSEDCGARLGPTGEEYLRRLSSAAAQMDTLTANLLTYSRVGHGDLPMSAVDLDRVTADALQELELDIRERGAHVSVVGPLASVVGYEEAIRQIVGNLVGNAIKFVPVGARATVTIRAERREEWIRTWVIDNGIGIELAYHERIFEDFERLHGRGAYAGHGLGLAIVRKAASRMGGRVGVESAVGQGSRFWFELRGNQP